MLKKQMHCKVDFKFEFFLNFFSLFLRRLACRKLSITYDDIDAFYQYINNENLFKQILNFCEMDCKRQSFFLILAFKILIFFFRCRRAIEL